MLQEKKYYPQLDAIRGISVLAVFFFHAYHPAKGNSIFQNFFCFFCAHLGMGLDVFFVLSAFLLTFLGIREYQKKGKFSFRNYLIRRILRIWPLYYLIMFLSFVVIKNIATYTGQQITLPPAEWYLFFVANFYTVGHVFFLQLLWTLSVEEQFYLFWGICLLLFQKKLKVVIVLFAFVSIVFNLVMTLYNKSIYFHTITYLFDMMAGAYAAYCVNKNNSIANWAAGLSRSKSLILYLIFPIFFICSFFIDKMLLGVANDVFAVLMKFGFVVYCCVVIIYQMVSSNKRIDLSKRKFLVYTGKISYGLYCFHGFVISFCGIALQKYKIELPAFLWAIILLLITFLIASLSYRFIEKPFLNLKEKLARV